MGGGYLQLVVSGKNDFLSINPQISYFKSVYRQYTRFSLESIQETADVSDISEFNDTDIRIKIPRNADLVTGLYFMFKLPAIYSGKYSNANTYKFKWIENIGANIIKEAKLIIGGEAIDTLYSEWMDVYSELMLTVDEKAILSKLSGNVNELHTPENSLGFNGNYPHICGTSTTQHTRNDSQGFNILTFASASETSTIPSIPAMDIKVPLPFWFHGKTGLALPLIALQYNEVYLDITLRPIYDLYTVIDPRSGTSFNKRVKVTSTDSGNLGLSNFVKGYTAGDRLSISSKVEIVYGFLDERERKRFAVNEHEYLITKLHKPTQKIVSGESSFNIDIVGSSPVKYIVTIPKRSDTSSLNNWNNYTNWLSKVPPYSPEYLYEDQYYDIIAGRTPFYTKDYSTTTDFTPSNLKNNIIKNLIIKFNGSNRFEQKSNHFFEYQQPLQHFKRNPKRGIYVYSFSLDPLNDQPTGACNFSGINVNLEGELNLPTVTATDYTYQVKIDVYIVSYNILKIVSGQGGLMYS